jgi:hypothetical protein
MVQSDHSHHKHWHIKFHSLLVKPSAHNLLHFNIWLELASLGCLRQIPDDWQSCWEGFQPYREHSNAFDVTQTSPVLANGVPELDEAICEWCAMGWMSTEPWSPSGKFLMNLDLHYCPCIDFIDPLLHFYFNGTALTHFQSSFGQYCQTLHKSPSLKFRAMSLSNAHRETEL